MAQAQHYSRAGPGCTLLSSSIVFAATRCCQWCAGPGLVSVDQSTVCVFLPMASSPTWNNNLYISPLIPVHRLAYYLHTLLCGTKILASVFAPVRALARVVTDHVWMHGPGYLGALCGSCRVCSRAGGCIHPAMPTY